MPFDLALFDLLSPYLLRGDSFGSWHAALSVIYVSEHSVTLDDGGVVIRGVARFSGDVHPHIDPQRMTFGVEAENTEGHPANDPSRRDPWIDVRDAQIEFQLSAPRQASQKVALAVSAIGGAGSFAPAAAVLVAYDNNPADAPPSDYPSTEFVLDLLLTTVILRPPFLRGARLEPSGQLVADPNREQVKITLPRIKVRLAQGSASADPLTATLLSAGASGLDDPGDLSVAELIAMDPPYAFIGPSAVVGFGFRTAVLDLSTNSTPPEVLSQFGYDESWTGLYLPEIRLFVAPNGARDLAVNAGARNLLIGLGSSAGITGDFELTVLDQGAGQMRVSARFYDSVGRSYAITRTSDPTATVALPAQTRLVVDIEGGLTPYTASAAFDGGAPAPGRLFDFDLSSQTTRTILISATGAQAGATPVTLTITANRRPTAAPAPPGSTPSPAAPAAEIATTSITQGGSPVATPRLKLVGPDVPIQATVAVDTDPATAALAHWTVDGADRGTSATVTVPLPPGASVNVRADLPGAPGAGEFTCYYRFDHPQPGTDTVVKAYAAAPGNTHNVPAPDEGLTSPWPPGNDAGPGITPLLSGVPNGATVTIKGFASFETGGATALTYNTDLARRRALGLRGIVAGIPGKSFNLNDLGADMTHWNAVEQGDPVRNLFWKAVATWPPQAGPATVLNGTVSRGTPTPVTPVPVPDNPTSATPPPPPSWFKKIGAKVRIVRNQFVACEVFGKFDIQTAAENRLAQGGVAGGDIPQFQGLGSQNPADGIIDIRVVVQIDDATDTVTVAGYFGADPADRDGLLKTGSLPGQPLLPPSAGRNYLGMAFVFMPLLSAAASSVSGDGALSQIGVTAAVLALPLTLAGLGWVNVERIIWYGGELVVQARPDGAQTTILLDLETAVSLDLRIGGLRLIRIKRETPLTVRYKAIGLLIGNAPGQPQFQFRPMFDASKGYSIDVSRPGAIEVVEPLGQILKILGARIARNNPLLFEVDLGFAIDLGVVSIDRARVRMRLDPPGLPELTAFGAGIDIPGALRGRGYLEMNEIEIKGQIDLTIIPVQVRVSAGLGIANIPPEQGGPATGVIVTLTVEFPVAIPLGNSGLGIYGFLGLFAMNYARNESAVPSDNMAPALAWLRATGGNPTDLNFWTPRINTWAFGVGAILGTMGSSVIFNLKGVFLLELPGPRLLLMMKANLLAVLPDLPGPAEGTFLAVIDLDMGRGTLTIGLSVDFNVAPLLRIKIPVEAFFNFHDTSDWHLHLGQYVNQIQATVLLVFDASGYLMLSGNGISGIPNLPAVTGFSIATGLHVSFTWGGGPLYARVAAGFDAVVGFTPFRMAGILSVRGTLHLFILDISAWAELRVDVGDDGAGGKISRIEGEICGRIEFFFFSIEGCVDFALGDNAIPIPDPPPLVDSLKLISRSPALVMGTGVDKPIDSGIGDGREGNSNPGDLPVVPIDAIPVLMMGLPPLQAAGLTFLGQALQGTPEAPADGFVPRGEVYFKYTVKQVELLGPVTTGQTPATWWKQKSNGSALAAQLALLSWVPEATPKAVGSSQFLEETVHEFWGTVCHPAAPAAPVFWTFLQQLLGPSEIGWQLVGKAWPDPPNVHRSGPPDLQLQVTERWRCGDPFIDKLRGIVPAEVQGAAVACPKDRKPIVPVGGSDQLVKATATAVVTAGPPVIGNPLTALRGTGRLETIVAGEALTLNDAIRRFSLGQAVTRASLGRMSLAVAPKQGRTSGKCFARVLASPVFDDGKLVAIGAAKREAAIKRAWKELRFRPGPLDDAIVVHTGAFKYARFYLWVPSRFLSFQAIVVASSNAGDQFFHTHPITPADVVAPGAFPASWTNASGPWFHDLQLLVAMETAEETYVGVLVEIPGGAPADRVQIGLLPRSRELRKALTLRPFYVAAIEVMRMSEATRFDYDVTEVEKNQGVLQDALGLDSADHALLQPGQNYQVRVTWDAERERRAGSAVSEQKSVANRQQSFWFRTDHQPPVRLDPWVLVALPGEAEPHYFASEAIRVVFATNNLNRLFGAYGKKLQARLKPASFRAVPSTPAVPHPFPLSPANLKPVKAAVLSPWEQAIEDLVTTEARCVPVSGERIRHSMITIPIPLDLHTDYTLDLEMLDTAAADGSPGVRVWRGTFSTGGFRTLGEFANSFQIARLGHRGVHAGDVGELAAIGVTFAARDPQGSELDTALLAAGLDPQAVPGFPRAIVFWNPGSPPQPVALLIDSTEPMWRARPIPTEITDPGLAAAKRYEMQPAPWLELVEQTGGDDLVEHIVPAPGGQRALVTLKPGSRGQHLRLALRRIAQTAPYLDGPASTDLFVTIFDRTLTAAPWEEVD